MRTLVSDPFDLLMLDWNMPGKDGLEILKWMQETLPEQPPVMMITNRSAKNDIAEALYAGAADYISKPEDRSVIAARISAILRRGAIGGAFDTEATYGNYRLNRIEQTVFGYGYRLETIANTR
jgi:DNA-binding response OmpR family regulator